MTLHTYTNGTGVDTMELSNGCVCCSLADDLVGSIIKLVQLAETKRTSYDHIVVECSGMYEFMNVCIDGYMILCIYVCMSVLYGCMCACMYVCMTTCRCVCGFTYMYKLYIYIYIYINM